MHFEELVKENAPRWPYPINYEKENFAECDVLVLGGGIAGCWAAIGAARKGAKVILVDKGVIKTSGSGGAGVDHWHDAVTNPACKITPEEFAYAHVENSGGYSRCGIGHYIACRESYDCLLDLEKMGIKIRDSEDDFINADFRDEVSKLLFAYDYTAKYCVRVWGSSVKVALYNECRKLGIQIYNHIVITSLLNKDGKQGQRVIGATGVNSRTGEFYVFKGKASILCMAKASRTWIFTTELRGLYIDGRPPNQSGDGHAIAWRAGAEFAGAEETKPGGGGPYGYPQYGVGNAGNTWFACTMVDADGKEIPWIDRDGRVLKTVAERYRPAPGQDYFLYMGGPKRSYKYKAPSLMPIEHLGLSGDNKKFKVKLPLYADLSSMPELERKVIWGMMIAQEAKTLIPIYWTYNQAGFNPEKDLLQGYDAGWMGLGPPQWKTSTGGGPIVDWDLKTSLDGLYAAGGQLLASGDHAYAATTGRYAGRRAADFALNTDIPEVDQKQIQREMARVYAPIKRNKGMDWKELNAGVCKVMQDYCGSIRSEELLSIGLKWFDEIEAGEVQTAFARNPHELSRMLEVFNIMTLGRMIMETSRARKASNSYLGFIRADYPEVDPPEWNKWITVRLEVDGIKTGELPLDYYGDLKENYEKHCGL